LSDNEPITRVSEPGKIRRRKPALARILGRWLLSLLILGVVLGTGVAWAWFQFTAPGPLTAKKVVQLPKAADRAQIATALQDQGVISDARIFSGIAALNELRHAKLKPGEYEFPIGATMEDVLAMLTRGAFLTYKVTIPEGWTSQMVVSRLNEQDELDGTIAQVPPEGSLLPETYIVFRGYPRDKLLADMTAAQTKLLDQEWAKHDAASPIHTKQDLVTLASIVEKETGVPEERPMVAAVFINRLNQKMRLQSDPTIIYGLVGGKGKLDHPITRDELDQQTPYNTYQIDGLPPGPIANPGKAAIEAVIAPANTNALYFVANGTGGHAFASTLEEHNANVKKWRAQNGEADTQTPAAAAAAPATEPAATVAPAAAAPTPAASTPAPKPGSTVIVNGKQIPIPTLKKPKP
jgi:UPF0755 protein